MSGNAIDNIDNNLKNCFNIKPPFICPVYDGIADPKNRIPLVYDEQSHLFCAETYFEELPEKVELIPSDKHCVIFGLDIENGKDIEIKTDAVRRAGYYIFPDFDPLISIFNIDENERFAIRTDISELNDTETAMAVCSLLDTPDIPLHDVGILIRAAAFCNASHTAWSRKPGFHYELMLTQRNELAQQCEYWKNAYNSISRSPFWKITYPARKVCDGLKYILKKNKVTFLMGKAVKSLFKNGFKITWQKVKSYRRARRNGKAENSCRISASERKFQERFIFDKNIKISILVPLYNTPAKFLSEMISSVLDQTYKNWELCLADGSDSNSDVGKTVQKYAKNDSRIRYLKLDNNLGISENTNKCIEISSGDYLALFDHDDILHPSALFEVMTAICDKNADLIYTDEDTFSKKPADAFCPHFKPDYSPDTLRSYNYICHFTVFSRELMEKAGGGFRKEFDGSQDYDIILRLTEKAESVVHIPRVLYFWRAHEQSVASDVSVKPYTVEAAKKALAEHLKRLGLHGEVTDSSVPTTYRIKYNIKGEPLISILIPNKDHISDLKNCIDSILSKSTYKNYEIIVVENNSTQPDTFAYYKALQKDPRIKVVVWEHEFNYSKINNFGAKYCNGDYLLLLNNDIEILTENWLEEMLMFAQREDVGAVGAMLYYPDDTVQHAGVIVGVGGVAGHSHKNFSRGHVGYSYRLTLAQNLSAVTAACMMIPGKVWNEVGGLNELYAVAFNDVDLCMRIRRAGYLIVWSPYTEAYHYESKSRGYEDNPQKIQRFQGELARFKTDWADVLEAGDPYYNKNLTLDREDFSLK